MGGPVGPNERFVNPQPHPDPMYAWGTTQDDSLINMWLYQHHN